VTDRIHYATSAEEMHALLAWAYKHRQTSLIHWLNNRPGSIWSEGAD